MKMVDYTTELTFYRQLSLAISPCSLSYTKKKGYVNVTYPYQY